MNAALTPVSAAPPLPPPAPLRAGFMKANSAAEGQVVLLSLQRFPMDSSPPVSLQTSSADRTSASPLLQTVSLLEMGPTPACSGLVNTFTVHALTAVTS